MADSRHDELRRIFDRALELPGTERTAFLARECGTDAGLKKRLEVMLAAAEGEQFLAAPTALEIEPLSRRVPDSAVSLREGPGTHIGPYKLLQQIGEGGFGVVFLAEQEKPVARKVALKIIKLGMDTRQVVARFEQERQALAIMEHPNIARVIDAGATDTGRPYFVMELVKGEPITEYCDKHNLTIDERLALFAQVCAAVQHAHTKGIIHRDLKPSNILVGTQDDHPQVKVIDFGIAKATDAKLTDKTLFTEHQQVIGTLQYMSPEQAEGSLDIDTRTDVYALGVVLYELLTGSTPFDAQTLRDAFYSEVQRMIREVDPPKPSTRLHQSADTLASIAARRRIEPKRLGGIVRGELDWIVMKALEKERQRRYESASGLADDIGRYLAGDAVTAAPPSKSYVLRKAIRRHRGAVIAGSIVLAALVVGLAGTLWQASVARGERDNAVKAQLAEAEQRRIADARAAELAQVSSFQEKMLGQIDATEAGVKLMQDIRARHADSMDASHVPEAERPTRTQSFIQELSRVNATDAAVAIIESTILAPAVEAAAKEFTDQPLVDATLRQTLAVLFLKLGRYDQARTLQEFALSTRRRLLGEEHPDTLASMQMMGLVLEGQGKHAEAEAFHRAALEGRRRVLGAEHADTVESMGTLSENLRRQGKLAEAEPIARESLELSRRVRGEEHRETLIRMNVLGYVFIDQGKLAEAEPLWREAYEKGQRVLGPDDQDTLVWTNNLGGLLGSMGRAKEAEKYYREALEGTRRARGEEHPGTLMCAKNVAANLASQGRFAEAESMQRETLETRRRVLGDEHPDTVDSMQGLGIVLRSEGKLAEAEPYLRSSLELSRRVWGADHPKTWSSAVQLARFLTVAGRLDESESLYREVLATTPAGWSAEHPDRLVAMNNFGLVLIEQGKLTEAESLAREVLDVRRRVSGDEHPETLIAETVMGRILELQGRLVEAEALYGDATEKFRRVLGNDHPNTLNSVWNMAGVLFAQGRFADAEPYYRDAALGYERAFGKSDARTGRARAKLGTVLRRESRFADAEVELLEAERVLSTAQGVTPGQLRSCRQELLALYEAWDNAEPGKGHDAQAAEWRDR